MRPDQHPERPTAPDRGGDADRSDVQAALFGGRTDPVAAQPSPTTPYIEIERARRQRLIVRAAVAGALILAVIVGTLVVLLRDGSDDTTASAQLIEAFECPGDPAPMALIPADGLVVDGIDESSSWLLVVEPIPELSAAWVRAADLDRSRTSLRVTACDRPPEPTPVPVAPVEPPAEPTATPVPTPTPEPAPTAREPAEVSVLVLNAARIEGAAGRVTEALADEGFQTRVPGNADLQTQSQVFYTEGFATEGELVALLLEIDLALVEPRTDATPGGADIVVVLGTDGVVVES